MKPREKKQEAIKPPGAFMPDGGYWEEAELHQRGAADRFVRALVSSRRGAGFSSGRAAQAIVLAKQQSAFPCWSQWMEDTPWSAVWTSTSAEEALKRSGLGTAQQRHWCGEQWTEGEEKHCVSQGHRRVDDPDMMRGLMKTITP